MGSLDRSAGTGRGRRRAAKRYPLETLAETIVQCRRCRDGAPVDGALTPEWMPPRGWAGDARRGARPFVFVTINPGLPLRMNDEDVEESYWAAHDVVEALPTKRAASRALLRLCTAAYDHVDGGATSALDLSGVDRKDLVFHKRCLSIVRACIPILCKPWDGDWKRFCWMTDLVKCSTIDGKGSLAYSCVSNCAPLLLRELRIVRPRVILTGNAKLKREVAALGVTTPIVAFDVYRNAPGIHSPLVTPKLRAVARALDQALPADFAAQRAAIRARYFPR